MSMSAPASLNSGEHISIAVFNCPSQLLNAVESELARRPKESNIIYAHAYKLSRLKQQRQRIAPNQFWVACYSNSQSSRRPNRSYGESTGAATSFSSYSSSSAPGPVLDFIVSCTEGSLGTYPLFIYSNHPASQCTPAFVEPRMAALANALLDLVSPTRIFSVFSLTAITHCFAAKWTQLTGTRVVPGDPWYSATSSYCTLQTLRATRTVSETGHSLRRARIEDLDECANLCQEFAATSPPFTLTNVQARQEAEELIRNNQLWVYEVPAQSPPSGNTRRKATAISTIVAVTRSTPTVSAITKVFTTYAYRKRGFGERLVAHVTKELLQRDPNRSVVLYVGHLLDAVRVYERVGFVGLNSASSGRQVESVDDWLELGFENTVIGHW